MAWIDSTEDTITSYRVEEDPYWNYVRVEYEDKEAITKELNLIRKISTPIF